jgi:hypothetical protein
MNSASHPRLRDTVMASVFWGTLKAILPARP